MADPRVSAVPVRECGEPLIDIRTESSFLVDPRKQADSDAFHHLRKSLLERLLEAQARLPGGLRFLIIEGYRPPRLQRRYFDDYAARLRAGHPGWPGERIRSAASRFVSPPEIAPHSAGAAVDLTLADADGRELDLGTPVNATPEDSGGACYTDAAGLGEQARTHRRILAQALLAEGFVNYPTEWWHWSFGDRYWALITGAAEARYGTRSHDAAG
ncbi:D-alanyl-D-alanine dipeptidase [Amycolatopsis bullii]|uniref:D-alanyl-D-alanine dipeptidase n=2 Tax=Pseudonocardiaceae TaxID=2070 RepID=A0ABQ3KBZ7_9PSEU|nr:D-alanyl-D-alanine dipeptidase [Amycolatopsis bullii]